MDDPELEKLKEKKLQELLKRQKEQKIQVINLNESNFDKVTSSEKPTLVDFWAEWCGPCKTMHPVFDRLVKQYSNIQFARLNVDSSQSLAMRFSVQSIPTFLMFKSGQIIDKMIGAVGEPGIHMICKKHS